MGEDMKRSLLLKLVTFLVALLASHGCRGHPGVSDILVADTAKASVVIIEEEVRIESDLGCYKTIQALQEALGLPDDQKYLSGHLIVVEKESRRMGLYHQGVLALEEDRTPKCWRVALAPQAPLGPKQRSGDHRTPEGWYAISDEPVSQFEDALLVHYPNCQDAKRGVVAGRIGKNVHEQICQAEAHGLPPPQYTPLGGRILIHTGGWEDLTDWTLGCIALSEVNLGKLRDSLPASKKAMILILP